MQQTSLEEIEAMEKLAEAHRELATDLPTDSPTRALILRAGSHWSEIAGSRRQALTPVPPHASGHVSRLAVEPVSASV